MRRLRPHELFHFAPDYIAALVGAVGLLLWLAQLSALAFSNEQIAGGRKVFERCRGCHSLGASQNGVGPTLHNLFGRKAGAVVGYSYSVAMRHAPIVWTQRTLEHFLANPSLFHRATK